MNKILIGYLPIGPTFKDRVVTNLLNFESYKYFDVLILTDDPEYPGFEKISHMDNVIIDDLNKHRERFPEFFPYEMLPAEKRVEKTYKDEIIGLLSKGTTFPLHLQRFILNYENIDKYPYIFPCDCDVTPIIDNQSDYERLLNYLENDMPTNSTSSNRCYQEWQARPGVREFTERWSVKLNRTIDYTTPIDTFDNPFKVYKFESSEKCSQFFNLWNDCLIDAFSSTEFNIFVGAWNNFCETMLAIVNKLEGIKVNTETKDYQSVSCFRTFTYPEDRYWCFNVNNGGAVIPSDKTCDSKDEYVQKNYEELKKFYISYGQKWNY